MFCIDARGSHEHSGHSKKSKETRYYKTTEHKGNNPKRRRIHVITIKKERKSKHGDNIESGCSIYQVLRFIPSYKFIGLNQNDI